MAGFTTRALTAGTWPDFAALAEANNGVWNGCGIGKARRVVRRRVG